MIFHSSIIFTTTIVEVRLRHTPVASKAHRTLTINIDSQTNRILELLLTSQHATSLHVRLIYEGQLTHTRLESLGITLTIIHCKGKLAVIEVLLAIAYRPPQFWVI